MALMLGAMLVSSCSDKYDDQINDLQGQIDAARKEITDLKGSIVKGVFVTGIDKTDDGIKVSFSDGGSKEISGFKAGAADVWTIVDGYWAKNDDKTDVKAKGEDGANGEDGNYWKPEEKDAKWYWVEYNTKGATGEKVEIEGIPAAIWDKDAEVLKLSLTDGTYVVNLTSKLKTLAFVPDAIDNGLGAINNVYSIYGYEPALRNRQDNANPVFAGTNNIDVNYRTSCKANDADYTWDFIARNVAITRATGDLSMMVDINSKKFNNDFVTLNIDFVKTFDFAAEGLMDNKLPATVTPGTVDSKENVIALAATPKDGKVDEAIVSDYQVVYATAIKDFAIYDTTPVAPAPKKYITDTLPDAKLVATADRYELVYTSTASTLDLSKYVTTWNQAGTLEVGPTKDINVDVEYNYSVEFTEGTDNTTQQNAYVSVDAKSGLLSIKRFESSAIGKEPIVQVTSSYNGVRIAEAYIPVVIVAKATPSVTRPAFVKDLGAQKAIVYRTLPDTHSPVGATNTTYVNPISWDGMSDMYDEITSGKDASGKEYIENQFFTQKLFNDKYEVSDIKVTTPAVDLTETPTLVTYASNGKEVKVDVAKVVNLVTINKSSHSNDVSVLATVTPDAALVGTQNGSIAYSFNEGAFLGVYNFEVVYKVKVDADKYVCPPTITVKYSVEVKEEAPVLAYNTSLVSAQNGVETADSWGKYVDANSIGTASNSYKMQQSVQELFVDHLETYNIGSTNAIEPNNFDLLGFAITDDITKTKYQIYTESTYTPSTATATDLHLIQELGLKKDSLMTTAKDLVNLKAVYTLDNGESIDGQKFAIRFNNPFEVKIADVELDHLPSTAGTYNVDKELVDLKVKTIKPGVKVPNSPENYVLENTATSTVTSASLIFTDAEYKGVKVFNYTLTPYPSDFVIDYSTKFNKVQGEFGSQLVLAPNGAGNQVVEWTYKGGNYIEDLKATSTVTVTIGDEFKFEDQVFNIIVKKQ